MQPTCLWLQPGHMGLQPRRHRAAASTAQGYRASACLAVGADELVVGLVVRLASHDLHLRPQLAHSTWWGLGLALGLGLGLGLGVGVGVGVGVGLAAHSTDEVPREVVALLAGPHLVRVGLG